MAFDWREYLNLARFLAQGRGSFAQEAAFRCATSRAYYAAFCQARNYARNRQGFSPAYDSSDHWRIRKHFRHQGMPDIALKLDDVRQWRNTCDYDDIVPNVSRLCTSAITQAQEVFDKLT